MVYRITQIPDLIDRTLSVEDQAKQARELRRQYKHDARELMADQEARKKLDQEHPILTFDELMEYKTADPPQGKGLSREDALKDLAETSSTTNEDVNNMLGV